MLVLVKISRVIGVDQLHISTAVGKIEGPREEVVETKEGITRKWYDIKNVFPVCSGGLHPALVPELIGIMEMIS